MLDAVPHHRKILATICPSHVWLLVPNVSHIAWAWQQLCRHQSDNDCQVPMVWLTTLVDHTPS